MTQGFDWIPVGSGPVELVHAYRKVNAGVSELWGWLVIEENTQYIFNRFLKEAYLR